MRQATVTRTTRETAITATVNLDGSGAATLSTGIGFFDHMLDQVARHGLIDLSVTIAGDLHIDAHHSVEDAALAIGQAIREALGERRGIARYGEAHAPMDEALTRCVIDISGRPHCVFNTRFSQQSLGTMDTELFGHFFESLAQAAAITLHIETLYGRNNHHIAESCFKAFARALRQAVAIDARQGDAVPSTKGVL